MRNSTCRSTSEGGKGRGKLVAYRSGARRQRAALAIGVSLCAAIAAAQAPGNPPAPLEPRPNAPLYRAKGEQYRIYNFPATGESIPYRLFVPSRWTPETRLP